MTELTLSEEVYQHLKKLIVTSELLPGTPLQEVELSIQLDVSRTPVREALRTLESEGLVEIQPRRGARVAQISRQDVWDAYEARVWVEPRTAAKAAKNINEDVLAELEELVEEMPVDPTTHEEASRVLEADYKFHSLIAKAASNRFIATVVSEAHTMTQRAAYFVPPERYFRSREEHRGILNTIVEGDSEAAADLMRNHLRNARNRMFGNG